MGNKKPEGSMLVSRGCKGFRFPYKLQNSVYEIYTMAMCFHTHGNMAFVR